MVVQENGNLKSREGRQSSSPGRKLDRGSPRAAAAEAAKLELQQQLAGLQRQLDATLTELAQQRTSCSMADQVNMMGSCLLYTVHACADMRLHDFAHVQASPCFT